MSLEGVAGASGLHPSEGRGGRRIRMSTILVVVTALAASCGGDGAASGSTETTLATTTTDAQLEACVRQYLTPFEASNQVGTYEPILLEFGASSADGQWMIQVWSQYQVDRYDLGESQAFIDAGDKILARCGKPMNRADHSPTTTLSATSTTGTEADPPDDLSGVNVIPNTPSNESLDSMLAGIMGDLASLVYGDPWGGEPPAVSCDAPGESPLGDLHVICDVQGFSMLEITIYRTSSTTAEWAILRHTGDS